MNLKRIIREEMDELQWIRDVKVNPWDGIEFKVRADKTLKITYKILDWGDPKGVRVVWRDNDDYRNKWKHIHYTREEVENYVNKGNWVIVNKNINESDDLDWIKDINPIPELKVGSCFVDVMDPTQTKWVITHFKMTPAGTRLVVVKNNEKIFVNDTSLDSEDIKYMHEEHFEQDLFSGRYKPCQR